MPGPKQNKQWQWPRRRSRRWRMGAAAVVLGVHALAIALVVSWRTALLDDEPAPPPPPPRVVYVDVTEQPAKPAQAPSQAR